MAYLREFLAQKANKCFINLMKDYVICDNFVQVLLCMIVNVIEECVILLSETIIVVSFCLWCPKQCSLLILFMSFFPGIVFSYFVFYFMTIFSPLVFLLQFLKDKKLLEDLQVFRLLVLHQQAHHLHVGHRKHLHLMSRQQQLLLQQ